jgi:hypothetical protein
MLGDVAQIRATGHFFRFVVAADVTSIENQRIL